MAGPFSVSLSAAFARLWNFISDSTEGYPGLVGQETSQRSNIGINRFPLEDGGARIDEMQFGHSVKLPHGTPEALTLDS